MKYINEEISENLVKILIFKLTFLWNISKTFSKNILLVFNISIILIEGLANFFLKFFLNWLKYMQSRFENINEI